ncbi:RNA polymerase sigma factor [Streptomyces tubercidicus]|uniref:RNA polymerase sigma factor n=1 Tax=Streptomyces tubercidicus TaxID=47759 RepID=UPI003466C6CB
MSNVDLENIFTGMMRAEPRRLFRRGLSLGLGHHDAEDLAQSAALRGWTHLSQVRHPTEPAVCAWLDMIARRLAVDLHKANGRRSAVEDDHAPAVSEEDTAERFIELWAVREAFTSLSARDRQALTLHAVEDLPIREVARGLGVTEVAARQQLSRARSRLRSHLSRMSS